LNNRIYKSTTWQHGFTIVELLIVIVVIGILAAIALVSYNGIQERARDAQYASEVNSVAKALTLYTSDGGEFPDAPASVEVYLSNYPLVDIPNEVLAKFHGEPMSIPGYVEYGYETCGMPPITGAKLSYIKDSDGQVVTVKVGSGC